MLWDLKLAGCHGPHRHFLQAGKHITLNGLLLLMECCPCLRWLSLPMDATSVQAKLRQITPNSTLTCIEFTELPIQRPYLVARFFKQHFTLIDPVITKFHKLSRYDKVKKYIKTWSAMNQIFVGQVGVQPSFLCSSISLIWSDSVSYIQ